LCGPYDYTNNSTNISACLHHIFRVLGSFWCTRFSGLAHTSQDQDRSSVYSYTIRQSYHRVSSETCLYGVIGHSVRHICFLSSMWWPAQLSWVFAWVETSSTTPQVYLFSGQSHAHSCCNSCPSGASSHSWVECQQIPDLSAALAVVHRLECELIVQSRSQPFTWRAQFVMSNSNENTQVCSSWAYSCRVTSKLRAEQSVTH
jgi:hypothetical protein